MTVVAQKAALRAQALARRAAVTAAVRQSFAERLAAICPDLIGRWLAPAEMGRRVVSLYHPFRDEADPLPLLQAMDRLGIATALPVTVKRGQPLRFHLWRPGDPLHKGALGIAEPLAEAPEAEPDLLFVPLAAFDAAGVRLGYGAGYYDLSLARLRRMKTIAAIGIGFAVQQVERLPKEAHDERLDAVVTESALLTFERT